MSETQTSELGQLLNAKGAAAFLGIPEHSMRQLIRMRRVRVLRLGRRVGTYAPWLEEYRAANTTEPTGDTRGSVPAMPAASDRPTGIQDLLPRVRTIRVIPARLRRSVIGRKKNGSTR